MLVTKTTMASVLYILLYSSIFLSAFALTCYDCEYSAWPNEGLPNKQCANSELSADFITPCSTAEVFCITEVTAVNRAFKGIARRCTIACNETCVSNGFGIDVVTCNGCCATNACNNEYKVSFYRTLMERQYRSYFKAIPNERGVSMTLSCSIFVSFSLPLTIVTLQYLL